MSCTHYGLHEIDTDLGTMGSCLVHTMGYTEIDTDLGTMGSCPVHTMAKLWPCTM